MTFENLKRIISKNILGLTNFLFFLLGFVLLFA